jgi:hypothetical protein
MKTDPVTHARTPRRTFSESVNSYLDYVLQGPVWLLPIHAIPLIALFAVSVTINQIRKFKEK